MGDTDLVFPGGYGQSQFACLWHEDHGLVIVDELLRNAGASMPVAKPVRRSLKQGGRVTFRLRGRDVDDRIKKLRYEVTKSPEIGRLNWNKRGQVTYIPPKNFRGVVRFSYRVSDGRSQSTKKTVVLRVKRA